MNNNCLYWKAWKHAEITHINDIINKSNGHFMSQSEHRKTIT